MTEGITDFFDRLAADPERERLLATITGVIRVEATENGATQQRCIRIDRGDVQVTSGPECPDADLVLSAERPVFDGVARGEINAMAAMLRGDLAAEGDVQLLVSIQRLFPDPPRAGGPKPAEATRE